MKEALLHLLFFLFIVLYSNKHVYSQSFQESEYERIIQAGITEYRADHFDEARRLFEEAHAMKPSARTEWGIGTVAFGAKDYVTAIKMLEKSLSDKRRALTETIRDHVVDILQKARSYIAKYTLYIQPAGEAVAITIDGDSVELSQDRGFILNPGEHRLVITARGYKTEVRRIIVVSGKNSELKIDLVPLSERKISPSEQSNKGTQEHQITDNNVKVNDNVADTDSTLVFNTLAWIGVTISALSLGGGIAALIVRETNANEYNDERCNEKPSSDEKCLDLGSAVVDAEILEAIGFSSAGLFAGAATVFFVLDSNQSNSEQRVMACAVGLAPMGVSCHVKF